MLNVQNLSKSFGIETIFEDVNFNLNAGDRVGLIGPNGCGKTTLLTILAGESRADRGAVHRDPPSLRIGYLTQGFAFPAGDTLGAFLNRMDGDLDGLSRRLEELAGELGRNPGDAGLQAAYDGVLAELASNGASAGRGPAALAALGLDGLSPEMPVATLSGGQKTRLALAGVLLGNPQLLLLDEPTNHLDLDMLAWLEGWLAGFPGAAMVVSHDRAFLDHVANRIIDFDSETHRLREYSGNYSDYLEQFLAERERQYSAYQDQVAEIRRMRADIARTKQQAAWVEQTTTPRQPGVRRYAKKVARKALSREKKLDRYLDSDERVEKPRAGWQMKLDFAGAPEAGNGKAHLGRDVLVLENLTVGYTADRPLVTGIEAQVRPGARIALTGPNGSGKTTLLRTITGQIAPLGGSLRLGSSVRMGVMAQEQEAFDFGLTALETIQQAAPLGETEARAFLHFFLFSGDDPVRPIGQLSFGERARLALARLVAEGCNFLLLDEPLNHLDIPSRARFEQALKSFDGPLLAVVHDRYFIASTATEVWSVRDGALEVG